MDIQQNDPRFSEMQNIKRRFFALRNGVIADRLRTAGDPHRIVFGLTLPQLAEVAAASPHDNHLAQMLWDNDTTRESRLLAPMLADADTFDCETARAWVESLKGAEEADILCHKLLRHLTFAIELVDRYADRNDNALLRYLSIRLAFNLIYKADGATRNHIGSLAAAEQQRHDPMTRFVATQLAEEIEFLNEQRQ